ncbi:MAG: DUF1501 domain-containing protein [Planctomycetota bacterium]|nr:DUF1501 domain-containing protein [Planctomycetota bacterium]HBO52313.1 DUF1501 domain-containing protein [Planctomycetota bacterium]
MHCRRYLESQVTRRQMLRNSSVGFGALALDMLMEQECAAETEGPLAPRNTHFAAKAKSIIFLYMDGGVSQVDSFDPKPRLNKEHGKPFSLKMEPTQFNNIGTVYRSHWGFKKYGQCGMDVSGLFPHIATCADDLALVRSMTAPFSEHNTANFFLHTGFGVQGRPSMGAWATYGLGSECRDLPGYVVLNGGLIPSGGMDNFNSGFLPASYQGSIFKAGNKPLANIRRREASVDIQRSKIALMKKLDSGGLENIGRVDKLESAIANYEMAFRMQAAVPELVDIKGEGKKIRELYGLESSYGPTRSYGLQCLIARRMVEKGVRFIELTCPRISGNDRWDAHGNIRKNHGDNARAVDQPIAGLIKDLKQRGMLDSTLIVFTGEFGRTPFAQGSNGRDHSPFGFSLFLCGGGVRGGVTYGATDDYGYRAVENKCELHDLHATMLHLAGMDHKRLTYRFSGRDMRLTDVQGNVLHDIVS